MRDRISRPPSRCALTMGGVQFFGHRQHAQQRLSDNQQEDNLRQSEASPTEEVRHGDKRDEQAQEAGDVAVPDFNPGFFQIVRAVRVVGGGGRAVGDTQQLAVTPRPIGTTQTGFRQTNKSARHNHNESQGRRRHQQSGDRQFFHAILPFLISLSMPHYTTPPVSAVRKLGFRATTASSGKASNLRDGMELSVAGVQRALDDFVRQCQRRPSEMGDGHRLRFHKPPEYARAFNSDGNPAVGEIPI